MKRCIRDFTPADYDALCAVHNRVFPDFLEDAANLARQDELREERHKHRRWVWEEGGKLLAFAEYTQSNWGYHPRKFFVDVAVDPDARRRGIGTALYDHVVTAVAEHDPIMLRGMVREDWDVSLAFARARGYVDGIRMEESGCDIAAFRPADHAAALARAEEQGIRIRSFPELEDDPARDRKLYTLVQQLLADMPRTEPHQKPPFELWQRRSLESPRFLPELNLVALDGDDYVGMSNFWRDLRPGHIGTGLTGVLASHRRRGLATALKVRALSAARAAGFKVTTTWNAAENAGMLGINRRLGFTARPAWMELELTLAAEEGESVGA